MKNTPKKKAAVKKTVSLTKSLGELIKDEDGFVSRDTILKVGLSTVAGLGMVGALTETASFAQHTNVWTNPAGACANNACFAAACLTHTDFTVHSSHSSHAAY